MNKDNRIREAIDESLAGVRFDAKDMRSVLRRTRNINSESPVRKPARSGGSRLGYAVAAAMLVMVAAPLSLLMLRTGGGHAPDIKTIAAAPGENTAAPMDIIVPDDDPIESPPPETLPTESDSAFTESDAIAAARTCFETQCDTGIFSFEEYSVSVQMEYGYGSDTADACYVVTMESIYDNGCTFSVVISTEGEVLSYSSPKLATVPAALNRQSAQVQSWYEKYGPYTFTWPMDVQAEFSRRYEGGALRMLREDEVNEQAISGRFAEHIHISDLTDDPDVQDIAYYTTLCSERASADGIARYQVYCFAGSVTDTLPPVYALLTFRASDGEFESRQILSTNGL